MNHPPEPHTSSWRELNPKRCKDKDNVPSVSIESNLLTGILIIAGILLVLHTLKIINIKTIIILITKKFKL